MHNTFKTIAIIIFIAAIIITLISAAFYLGVYIGKHKYQNEIETTLRLKILNEIAERIGEVPSNIMAETPTNMLTGTINAIDPNEIVLVASAQTIREAIWQQPQAYKIKINKQTKIFYTTINPDFVMESSIPLNIDHPISVNDLKKDEFVSVKLDTTQPTGKYLALEIRVSR